MAKVSFLADGKRVTFHTGRKKKRKGKKKLPKRNKRTGRFLSR